MHINKNHLLKFTLLLIISLIIAILVNSQVPTTTFLNDSATYDGPDNTTLIFHRNITFEMNPIHKFELQSGIGSPPEGGGSPDAEIEYRSGNTTGFLLRFIVNDEDGIGDDKVTFVDCANASPSFNLCVGSACGGKDFNTFTNITVVFNSTRNNATIHVGTANLSVNICTNATMIGSVRYISTLLPEQGYSVKNNIITADNRAPIFLGNISNFTIQKNTFIVLNISGNFTEPDGENLTFGFSDLENFTININQTTGIANLTPEQNFSGLRFVRFSANDSKNITFSTNISINVIEAQDTLPPVINSISATSSGTTTVAVTLSATTDETAMCRFAASDLNFTNMARMSATNSTSHSNSQDFTSDTSGTYYVRCNDTAGNVMNFSNSTAFSADVQEPSSSSSPSPGGGGGGGGTAGYICNLDWECEDWSECADGKQTRKCKLVQIPNFISLEKCPQHKIPEQEGACTISAKKESCDDRIQNQGEIWIDCGGPCDPCFTQETKKESNKTNKTEQPIFGPAVIAPPAKLGINHDWIFFALVLLILLVLLCMEFGKRIFRKKKFSKKKRKSK